MKTLTFFLFVLWVSGAVTAPLETTITYQGQLQQSGFAADGPFDFEFELFDEVSGGNQVGTTLPVNDVVVVDGIFTVELNFGTGPYAGDQLWLAVRVRAGASTCARVRNARSGSPLRGAAHQSA